MQTPFLKDHLIFSCGDHPDKISIVAYTNVLKCNLSCTNCHNRETARKLKQTFSYMSLDELENNLKSGILMGVELLVISGGEPTLQYSKFETLLKKIKQNIPIRMDTNGLLPDVVEKIKPNVTGFAVDIKIPIKDTYTEEELNRYRTILGIDDIVGYSANVSKTISIVDGMENTLFRTVKYPNLIQDDIDYISNFVKSLSSKHYWNEFMPMEKVIGI